MSTARREGRINTLKTEAGYGFIRSAGESYFFHKQDCCLHWSDRLLERWVSFEATTDRGKARAVEVRAVQD